MTRNDRDSEVIEEDIRQTRQGIDEKVQYLRDRISPGDVVEGVTHFVKENSGAIANGVGRGVRDNPLPAALIGAGVLWFAFSSLNHRHEPGDEGESEGRLERKAAAARDSLREEASHAAERAEELRHSAARRAKRASRAGGDFVKGHPILVGAAGIILGAAVAASLPRWQREDRLYGAQSDDVKSTAKAAAAKQGHKVQESAKEAVEKARQAAEEKAAARK